MTRKIRCEICQNEQKISTDDWKMITSIACDSCGMLLRPDNSFVSEIPGLDIGEIVKIFNKQHVWHGELAIIRDKKHKLYRVELLGKLVWVPEDWVKKNDTDDIN